jgi:hypothetical protein
LTALSEIFSSLQIVYKKSPSLKHQKHKLITIMDAYCRITSAEAEPGSIRYDINVGLIRSLSLACRADAPNFDSPTSSTFFASNSKHHDIDGENLIDHCFESLGPFDLENVGRF